MTELLIHANPGTLDGEALKQIYAMRNHPVFWDLIAIMPDAQAGVGCTVGTTCKFKGAVIPKIIGSDIGCGVRAYKIGKIDINFVKLDTKIRNNIPLGFSSRTSIEGLRYAKKYGISSELDKVITAQIRTFSRKISVESQIGTLGGGNHFIEIGKDSNDEFWLIIHTGSRNFGLTIAKHYQDMAVEYCKTRKIKVPKDMEYLLVEEGGSEYFENMRIAQCYAKLNRYVIIRIILDILGIDYNPANEIESIHNYIGDDGIVRKGAISAYFGEKVVIPMNMQFGVVIGEGLGNEKYNFSAPHGSGRKHSRGEMKRKLKTGEITLEMFEKSMVGIYSTSINEGTIDESPFAYKDFSEIEEYLEETVKIKDFIKPIYNIKA